MSEKNGNHIYLTMCFVMVMIVSIVAPVCLMGEEVEFEASDVGTFDAADAAFGMGDSGSEANTGIGNSDATVMNSTNATDGNQNISAIIDTTGSGNSEKDATSYMGTYAKTNLGSIPASVVATMTYEQYEAHRRSKAEAFALTDSSYGTAEFLPARQEALERVIQQAKDMQYSQEMIDEIAKMFRLVDYVDYDYHVKYGKDPANYLKFVEIQKRRREQAERERARFNKRLQKMASDNNKATSDGGAINMDTEPKTNGNDPGFTSGTDGGMQIDDESSIYINPSSAGDKGWLSGGKIREQIEKFAGSAGAQEIPDDVVSSIEASVHNAILEKLKDRGYDVAALNVFLQNLSEIKVISIITTSELPKSSIRETLRNIRAMIETEVLQRKFKALRLAQLSSFTILNEVDNTFYEHPVLYWQMQLTGWDAKGRRVAPGTPSISEALPQADSSPEADALLDEFIGN